MKKSKVAGVYRIRNNVTGVFYIGSTSCFSSRFSKHRAALVRGDHDNIHMQRSWAKHGEGAFSFEVLLVSSKENAVLYEQIFLDEFAGDKSVCYNVSLSATNSTLGHKWSDESRARLSKVKSGVKHSQAWVESAQLNRRFKRKSESHRNRISENAKDRKPDPDYKALVSEKTKSAMSRDSEKVKKKTIYCSNGLVFDSAYSAVEWLVSNGWPRANKSGVTGCCKGRHHSCYGLKWSYTQHSQC